MTIFVVVATQNAGAVQDAAKRIYNINYLKLTEDACLVAGAATPTEVTERLGLTQGAHGGPYLGSAVITSVGSYFGVADPAIWEWMRTRWSVGGLSHG